MRIGIVNDVRLASEALRRAVTSVPEHQVAWIARDGAEAVRMCAIDRPDVVLMDLIMPVMNGVEATRRIMQESPCPILIVTSTVSGNFSLVYDAMGRGALDAVNTPVLGPDGDVSGSAELLRKIALVGRSSRVSAAPAPAPAPPASTVPSFTGATKTAGAFGASGTFGGPTGSGASSNTAAPGFAAPSLAPPGLAAPGSAISGASPNAAKPGPFPPRFDAEFPLIAIGASTGGPQALSDVLGAIPGDLRVAVVIVQHIAADFSQGLADWLNQRSRLPVTLAKSGMQVTPGRVFLAGTDDHMVLRAPDQLDYTPHPKDNPMRPSVDVFFGSLTAHWRGLGVAVILTGMGRDGAAGMLQLKQRGWHTIAQDVASSVVPSMPSAAAEQGAARSVLPLAQIGPALVSRLRFSPAVSK